MTIPMTTKKVRAWALMKNGKIMTWLLNGICVFELYDKGVEELRQRHNGEMVEVEIRPIQKKVRGK